MGELREDIDGNVKDSLSRVAQTAIFCAFGLLRLVAFRGLELASYMDRLFSACTCSMQFNRVLLQIGAVLSACQHRSRKAEELAMPFRMIQEGTAVKQRRRTLCRVRKQYTSISKRVCGG